MILEDQNVTQHNHWSDLKYTEWYAKYTGWYVNTQGDTQIL